MRRMCRSRCMAAVAMMVVLSISVLAGCAPTPQPPAATPTAAPPSTATLAPSSTSTPAPTSTPISVPTLTPTVAPSSTPVPATPTPSAPVPASLDGLPTLPAQLVAPQALTAPLGLVTDPCDRLGVALFARDGKKLGQIRTSPSLLCIAQTERIYVAGGYQGKLDQPVVFASREDGTMGLWVSRNDQVTLWASTTEVVGIAGIAGQPTIVYSTLQPEGQSGALRNQLFMGDVTGKALLAPMLTVVSAESISLAPLAIHTENDMPIGVWLTSRPYGIGGDIVFDPRGGLYYFNLADSALYEVLSQDVHFSNLSPDQTRLAYTGQQAGAPALFVRDVAGGDALAFVALPDSDHGLGAAVFSPANRYVAWSEARGGLMQDNLHMTIRVAATAGQPPADYPAELFDKVANLGKLTWLFPAGWLDDQTLVVQGKTAGKDAKAASMALNAKTGEITYLAPGAFVGFLYP